MLEEKFPNVPYKVILSGLSPEDLKIFFLSVVHEMSAEQIAGEIEEPPDRVPIRLQQLRAKIRDRAKRYFEETVSRKRKEEIASDTKTGEQADPELMGAKTSSQKKLSQRLYGILKFNGDPPNDEEVKDMISDYLIRKYS